MKKVTLSSSRKADHIRINLEKDVQSGLTTGLEKYRFIHQALPELDASANAVAIQTLKLENEGWERDYEVTEPTEPQFTEPEG